MKQKPEKEAQRRFPSQKRASLQKEALCFSFPLPSFISSISLIFCFLHKNGTISPVLSIAKGFLDRFTYWVRLFLRFSIVPSLFRRIESSLIQTTVPVYSYQPTEAELVHEWLKPYGIRCDCCRRGRESVPVPSKPKNPPRKENYMVN